jgi:hypothetical protein
MATLSKPVVDRFQDWINLVLAAFLFVSPWLFGFTSHSLASWNAWICGAVIAALALAAIVRFAEWEEWINVALGAWLVIAPWILGFTAVAAAMWTHVILGLVILVFAGWSAWSAHRGGTQATA